MKNIFFTLALFSTVIMAQGQNAAGNAFRIDYDEFLSTTAVKYFNCGTNDILNPGDELTVMGWIQFRDVNDNQKIIGKFNLDASGFVLGLWQGRIYSEAWNPDFLESLDGEMNLVDMDWYHLAMTYEAGAFYTTYINGVKVGEYDIPNQPLTANDNPLIIGVSPWEDFNSFQSFGNLDEFVIYDQAMTQDEIKAQMFNVHDGNENGLVAGYNFNETTGSTASDVSGNGNDGNGINFTGSEWVPSSCILANEHTASAIDLNALWSGVTLSDPRFTTTTNGMNMLASGLTNEQHAVFGHTDGSGVTTAEIPSTAPSDFERSDRVWHVTSLNSPAVTLFLSLEAAAAGGVELSDAQNPENYTLLRRGAGGTQFEAVAQGSSITNGVVQFIGYSMMSGEYSIGVGSAPIEPSSIAEQALDASLFVSPNPSTGLFNIRIDTQTAEPLTVSIQDASGRVLMSNQLILSGGSTEIDLSPFSAGTYLLTLTLDAVRLTRSLIKY